MATAHLATAHRAPNSQWAPRSGAGGRPQSQALPAAHKEQATTGAPVLGILGKADPPDGLVPAVTLALLEPRLCFVGKWGWVQQGARCN